MARLMGFEERILCGVPLVNGNYADKGFARAWHEGREREDGNGLILDGYRRYVAKDTGWHDGCFSMSGYTREVLGEPCP